MYCEIRVRMHCYLCKNSDFVIRKGEVRDDKSLQIYECSSCGLVSLSSKAHIQEEHYEHSGMHGGRVPSMESWLRDTESDDERRFHMLKAMLPNKKVLDFGCGAGGFLMRARQLAAQVAGIELERRVREYWDGQIAIHPDFDSAGGGHDLITAFHVIEHLVDPRGMLGRLGDMLAKNGRLVVEVPSSDDALLTVYESDAFQRFTYWSQHLFLLNVETLQTLARQAGLKVVSIQQHQRYPLSNHLYWLSRQKPGGHERWAFLDSPALTEAYAASLAAVGKCDTLIAYLEKNESCA